MIGIFNCGGDLDHYDDDYDDSLYQLPGGDDDITLRQYRGRADRPEELGGNLRALAMRRMSSQRVAVNVGRHGGRLSGSVGAGGRLAKRRGSTAMSSIGMDSSGDQFPEHPADNEESHVALTHVYTIRRPQSFLFKRVMKSPAEAPSNATSVFGKERHKSGIPKEICIEMERELDVIGVEQRTTQERQEHQLDTDCHREPVEICDNRKERQQEPEERLGCADSDASQDMVGSLAQGAAISSTSTGAPASRPPLPDGAKSKHIRVRIRKPLGIVFESLQEGSVRIIEMSLSGNAARCGRLAIWDELFSINGKSMKHRSFDFVMEQFANVKPKSKLDLVFRRRNAHALGAGRDVAADDKYGMPEYDL
eukprot:CAMPEP_0181020228 /NCGR_PEP_ID=MMETSP1070-20121207/337_1 /TAXON_ID=265543 /ORGANISM="Minutocellus polymorphus, Strain NH13" /LENGTH=364 /DNA_ID=CAMNT_0023097025 /DNA_START=160 /DNA_END=1254 /DNA_ORIENTATION=-